VWVVGSVNVDLVARVASLPVPGETVLGADLETTPGGKGANQAVAAARMGAAVSFVGAVGTDEVGASLAAGLAADGIDLGGLRRAEGPSGHALIAVDAHGQNQIVVAPGANAEVDAAHVAAHLHCRSGDVVVGQCEIPLDATRAAFRHARDVGARTVFNPAPALPAAVGVMDLVDVAVVNEIEQRLLPTDDGARPPVVVVTLGDAGADVITPSGRHHVPARAVTVVDTTGAGDCFVGVLAAGLVAGRAVADAVAEAVVAASIAVGRPGATAAMPTSREVASALDRDRRGA
jgi:ribokinase